MCVDLRLPGWSRGPTTKVCVHLGHGGPPVTVEVDRRTPWRCPVSRTQHVPTPKPCVCVTVPRPSMGCRGVCVVDTTLGHSLRPVFLGPVSSPTPILPCLSPLSLCPVPFVILPPPYPTLPPDKSRGRDTTLPPSVPRVGPWSVHPPLRFSLGTSDILRCLLPFLVHTPQKLNEHVPTR